MTYMIKISLFGLSGSGKTTILKAISDNCYLMSEQPREITPKEAKYWNKAVGTKIGTTIVPNFAYLRIDEDSKIIKEDKETTEENDDICIIIDTCGQELFFNLTKQCVDESNGLIFVIDSTIPVLEQKDELIRVFANVMSNFNDYIPMVVVLNKQDILQKKKTEKESSKGYDGKAEKFRPTLRAFLPELKSVRFFNTSALMKWNVEEAVESLIKQIMGRIVKNKQSV